MKKVFAIVLSILTVVGQAHAYIVSDEDNDSSIYVDETSMSYEQKKCSDYLYQRLSTASSKTDTACTRGRTDLQFMSCTVNLSKDLDDVSKDRRGYPHPKNVIYAAEACVYSRSFEMAKCAVDLYLRGGLYISNPDEPVDAIRICSKVESFQIKNCVLSRALRDGDGVRAAKACIEQYDPVAKARREAELRRIEEDKRRQAEEARRAAEQRAAAQRAAEQRAAEQRAADQRAAEQRRLDEQRRQEEQRRQSTDQQQQQRAQEQKRQEELRRQQEEQRKKDEEARKKKEEEEKKKQQEQQKQPSNPPANNGGGVIVDLPAFE